MKILLKMRKLYERDLVGTEVFALVAFDLVLLTGVQ